MLAAVVLVVCATTPVFNILTVEASVGSAFQGLLDGFLVSILVGSYLLFVRDGLLRDSFRRLSFSANLAISGSILVAIFLLARGAGQFITSGEPARFVESFYDAHLLYALPFFVAFAFVLQFVVQVNRMIGTNVLRYFMTGVYHRPKEEERIFLFLDLVGSTQLAERLGSARYYELLRRFVEELTEPILESEGEIYQYAGDEVVITWPMAVGARDANCVRCFFLIRDAIARDGARYGRDFGGVPAFRAGLHGGSVTSGELGDLKQQIVFVGDILNTAARLEEYAKRTGHDIVASGALLDRLTLPAGVVARPCEELTLRGKEERVTAYALEDASISRERTAIDR
jgi:adenylate cyclase